MPDELPSWLTEDDLDYYVEMFDRSGARGPVNWYRNIPLLLADTAELDGVKIPQPTRFVIGSRDATRHFNPPEGQAERFEDLRDQIVINGAGHWLQLEATDQLNELMLDFYAEFVT